MPHVVREGYTEILGCPLADVDTRLWDAQSIWDDVYSMVSMPCRGFQPYALGDDGQYCLLALCPACWHRRFIAECHAIVKAPQTGVYLLRRTSWMDPEGDPIDPEDITALCRDRPGHSLICRSPMFLVTQEALRYALANVVRGDRLPKSYFRGNQIVEPIVGDLLDFWIKNTIHPSSFYTNGISQFVYEKLDDLRISFPKLFRVGRGLGFYPKDPKLLKLLDTDPQESET